MTFDSSTPAPAGAPEPMDPYPPNPTPPLPEPDPVPPQPDPSPFPQPGPEPVPPLPGPDPFPPLQPVTQLPGDFQPGPGVSAPWADGPFPPAPLNELGPHGRLLARGHGPQHAHTAGRHRRPSRIRRAVGAGR
ncbi:MAG TPA: hypothetical protein VGX23_10370 [Actinocrinis sp.]|nr:hypothetical protein [Actinocrinis sp.]